MPVLDSELENLVDKNDPGRKLIDRNRSGFKTLYFIREKHGSIGLVRNNLELQLGLGRVVKGLNFLGDDDYEVTEIITLEKQAEAVVAASEALLQAKRKFKKRRNILGYHLPADTVVNPYIPI